LIPDSPLAVELLDDQLRKFGEGTWLEKRRSEIGLPKQGDSTNEWVCGATFTVFLCMYNPNTNLYYNCVESEPICAYWVYVYEDPIGGGGGGSGFPSDDPGECDPYGAEPCYLGGGGSQPPPDPPNPCTHQNPPLYCTCPVMGNSILDTRALQMTFEDLWSKQSASQKEQAGFLYKDDLGNWQFFELKGQWVKKRTYRSLEFYIPSGLPQGIINVHTHPAQSTVSAFGITREYQHKPSEDDLNAFEKMGNMVDHGVILDPKYIILFDKDGNITKKERCGY
jgi:hypothetical protein